MLTLGQRAQFLPGGDGPFLGILAHDGLQEKQWYPTGDHKHQVGHKEGPSKSDDKTFHFSSHVQKNRLRLSNKCMCNF